MPSALQPRAAIPPSPIIGGRGRGMGATGLPHGLVQHLQRSVEGIGQPARRHGRRAQRRDQLVLARGRATGPALLAPRFPLRVRRLAPSSLVPISSFLHPISFYSTSTGSTSTIQPAGGGTAASSSRAAPPRKSTCQR